MEKELCEDCKMKEVHPRWRPLCLDCGLDYENLDHEDEHRLGRKIDLRICKMIGCPYGDVL